MHIYYRCSFRSSDGYKTADYQDDVDQLIPVDGSHTLSQEKMSKTIYSTLCYALGRSMVLASDELGNYFFGVYNLIEGDYDKYVNAVFTDTDREKICRLFVLFCDSYQKANQMLLNTINRIPMDQYGLEFSVSKKDLEILIQASNGAASRMVTKQQKNQLFAFITEEYCSDHIEKLTECCNLCIKNAIQVEQVRADQTSIDVENLTYRKQTRGILYILLCIVASLILLIGIIFAQRPKRDNAIETGRIYQTSDMEIDEIHLYYEKFRQCNELLYCKVCGHNMVDWIEIVRYSKDKMGRIC